MSSAPTPDGAYDGYGANEAPSFLGFIVGLVRAAAEGLLPLVILAAVLALFWEATIIARIFGSRYGIDVMQHAVLVTAGGGLVVALVVYLIASIRTIQGARERHRINAHLEANITVVFLAISLIFLLMPLLMALGQHQHPAP